MERSLYLARKFGISLPQDPFVDESSRKKKLQVKRSNSNEAVERKIRTKASDELKDKETTTTDKLAYLKSNYVKAKEKNLDAQKTKNIGRKKANKLMVLEKPVSQLLFYKKFDESSGKVHLKLNIYENGKNAKDKKTEKDDKVPPKKPENLEKPPEATLTLSDFSDDDDSIDERKRKKKPKPKPQVDKLPKPKLPDGSLEKKQRALERWRQMGRRRSENERRRRQQREEKLRFGLM